MLFLIRLKTNRNQKSKGHIEFLWVCFDAVVYQISVLLNSKIECYQHDLAKIKVLFASKTKTNKIHVDFSKQPSLAKQINSNWRKK